MDMIEAALRAENEEVLAAAKEQQRSPTRTRHSASSASGKRARNSSPWNSPRSPTRALLDVDSDGPRRASTGHTNGHISTSGYSTSYINHSPNLMSAQLVSPSFVTHPTIDTSIVTPAKVSKSAATSPVDGTHRSAMSNAGRLRTSSDASNHPASFGARKGIHNGTELPSLSAGTSPSNSALQKKTAQGSGWSKMMKPSAMAEVVRGGDLITFGTSDRVRNHSTGGLGRRFKSRSPAGWVRSSSPGVRGAKVNGQPASPKAPALKKTVSNTSSPLSNRPRADSDSSVEMDPRVRSRRDSIISKDGSEAVSDSSDGGPESSDEENYRGRRLSAIVYDSEEFHQLQAASRLPKDMMEATGQERDNFNTAKEMILQKRAKKKAEKYGRKISPTAERRPERPFKVQTSQPLTAFSLPSMTITSPTEKTKSSRPKCRPTTSFDKPYLSEKPPAERKTYLSTPGSRPAGRKEVSEAQFNNPDAQANIIDIGNAQKLPIQRTMITDPHPSRTLRQIVRGNFNAIHKEARNPATAHPRRLRKYLVATDLSSEATHALEWCVGTVLRDGDTLLAVYCVDEETGITSAEETQDESTTKDWTDLNGVVVPVPGKPVDNNYFPRQNGVVANSSAKLEGNRSRATSPIGHRRLPKAVEERHRAVQQITERVEKLLRKTILQVKVVVEVIHCKSPKHLITEIIDLVSPTLVVLGSRGRGALKGVLLGSFSNYLVTKSSVPVMVARKKLHGKKKFKRRDVQHANNLGGEAVKVMIAATDQEE